MKLQNELIHLLKKSGCDVIVNNKKTKELIDYSFNVYNFDYKLNFNELLYVRKKLKKYNKQILIAVKKLKNDKFSRQAVIQFNVYNNLPECLIQIQLLIRKDKLYVIVTSRSLDVKTKLFQDIEIARQIANMFGFQYEYIKFNVGSLHYYT